MIALAILLSLPWAATMAYCIAFHAGVTGRPPMVISWARGGERTLWADISPGQPRVVFVFDNMRELRGFQRGLQDFAVAAKEQDHAR